MKWGDPFSETIYMLSFDSMLQQRDTMDEVAFPLSKSWNLMPEFFYISKQPNVPAHHNYHLHKKRPAKTVPSCRFNRLQVRIASPFNLQIRQTRWLKLHSKNKCTLFSCALNGHMTQWESSATCQCLLCNMPQVFSLSLIRS
jgi:hypothetical protein